MIIAGLMMLTAAQAGPAPVDSLESQPSADIVVIGRRARAVRWDWRVDKGGRLTKCKITRSSGDKDIDQIGCEATRRCAAGGIRKAAPMKACIVPVRNELIRALADARAEQRARRLDNAEN
jgi:hypothetical protein